jgi:hypothetical protein
MIVSAKSSLSSTSSIRMAGTLAAPARPWKRLEPSRGPGQRPVSFSSGQARTRPVAVSAPVPEGGPTSSREEAS